MVDGTATHSVSSGSRIVHSPSLLRFTGPTSGSLGYDDRVSKLILHRHEVDGPSGPIPPFVVFRVIEPAQLPSLLRITFRTSDHEVRKHAYQNTTTTIATLYTGELTVSGCRDFFRVNLYRFVSFPDDMRHLVEALTSMLDVILHTGNGGLLQRPH